MTGSSQLVGRTLSHYRILEEIGAGGMGVVYRARDEQLEREIALKVLHPSTLGDEAARRRFRKEALALAKLNHPNIEIVHEFGNQDGFDFLVTEYIPGTTLDAILAAGALTEKEVLRLGSMLCEGLAAAHEQGVVHRDVKPGNLRLTPDGRLKILDFGIAQLVRPKSLEDPTASLTYSQEVRGTLPYMAPEQLRHENADHRSDIWAIGAVLYEMATGRRPFPHSQYAELIGAILHEQPPSPSSLNSRISSGMDRTVLKALDKEPERRYQFARELRVDLERLRARYATHPRSPSGAPSPDSKLEVAHVLFMDIVSYSKLPMDEQRRALGVLQDVVRGTSAFSWAQTEEQLIRLPTGDGMALVFFGDAEAAAHCAMEVAKTLRTQSDMQLRMGIHTGPVYRVADINANLNVAGGGINMAQRVMDCGDAGHILVSKAVADVLNQVSTWGGAVHDLGEAEVKHGVRIHIFNLYSNTFGNPALPRKLEHAATEQSEAKQGVPTSPRKLVEFRRAISAAAAEQARPYFRTIVGAGLILLISPFVGGTVLLLGQMLSRSNPRSLAYVCTVIFDVVTFYLFLRFEKTRNAREQARRRLDNWAQTSRSASFRGLDPFSEVDSLPGTERKRQARRLVTSIKDPGFRFGVVSGDVGCGKTSLLQSEVQRLLKSDNIAPIFLPRADIVDARNIGDLCSTIMGATTTYEGSRLRVLIIDQIEELLIRFPGREAREKLGTLLGGIIRGDRPCKVVCAVRKDYFLDLYDVGAAMGVDVHPTLMLHNFSPEEAKDVILECAAEEGLTLSDVLVGTIVADLAKEAQVRPPELQIVCTALTVNFTTRHYKELGGAKGILESYLTLTLETCADQQVARLILRQMCDFDKQAKADAKSIGELSESIGPLRDDREATERLVRQVLDHLVRSRLAIMVGGKFSLIHDYWVSVIHDATIHDRSGQERADELLRRYLHEQEAGFASTLGSSQLRLVRRFARPDLLKTQEATSLLRKSAIRQWVLRGITALAIIAVIAGGLISRTVTWQMVLLADLRGHGAWNRGLMKEAGLFVMSPIDFGPQERSSISVWDIKSGRRVSEYTADAWAFSAESGVLLYTNQNQAYLVDLKGNKQSTFVQMFKDGASIGFSRFARCALYTSSTDTPKGPVVSELALHQAELWTLPDGRLLARTSLEATNLEVPFVSDKCDRAVLLSVAGASLIPAGPGSSDIFLKSNIWLWVIGESKPMLISSRSTASRASATVDERTGSIAVLETDTEGRSSIGLWDLQSGRLRLARSIELGPYSYAYLRFSSDRQYIKIFSQLSSEAVVGGREKVTVVRTSDLQTRQVTKDQSPLICRIDQNGDPEASDYLLWSTPSHSDSIWDVSRKDPVPLNGLNSSDVIDCSVSTDRSSLALLRKDGSAELWNFKGNKVADLRAGGPVIHVFWTLQGTDIGLVRDTGQIILFDKNGGVQALLLAPGSGERGTTTDTADVSFERSCSNIVVWTPGGRVVRYTKKLQVFGLPYLLPIWHRTIPACDSDPSASRK